MSRNDDSLIEALLDAVDEADVEAEALYGYTRATLAGASTELATVRRERDEAIQARDAASTTYRKVADELAVTQRLVADMDNIVELAKQGRERAEKDRDAAIVELGTARRLHAMAEAAAEANAEEGAKYERRARIYAEFVVGFAFLSFVLGAFAFVGWAR